MRNSRGFYTKSNNTLELENKGIYPAFLISQSELKAKGLTPSVAGLEWHHHGNKIAFYCYDEKDYQKLDDFKARIDKIKVLFSSKAQAMKYLSQFEEIEVEPVDKPYVRIKKAKYGKFVCVNDMYYSKKDTFIILPNDDIVYEIEKLFI